ncbi:hypothetical protein NCS52_01475100 [Fusarium sp. LHS14.1]|nr:hypothetical protein NCS52_01475100 [Fusarium sp. LHS14.1]
MRPILPLFALGTSALQTGTCDYSKNNWYHGETSCINPDQTASAEFTWPPLFPKGAKFVYAVDGINGTDVSEIQPLMDPNKVKDRKATLVGWWLEYDSISLNNTGLLMLTEMNVFFTNTTSKIGGGHNGCEGLLGSKCLDKINSTLRELWNDDQQFGAPLLNLNDEADSILEACPKDFFSTWEKLQPRIDTLNQDTDFNTMLLASEAPPKTSPFDQHNTDAALPSGNKSFTYSRTMYDERELAFQERKAAVAILMRYPARDSETNDAVRNTTIDDITVEFVCARLKKSNFDGGDQDDGETSSNDSDDEDAAGSVHVPGVVFSAMILGVLLWQTI